MIVMKVLWLEKTFRSALAFYKKYMNKEINLNFPKDPTKMSRKERRKWYKDNRKRFGLPRWSELNKLKEQ